MNAPAVSVILPTCNRAALLPRAIESVLAQSCADFELLIVDDGSTDDSAAVIAGYGDARIQVLHTTGRTGSAAARRLGIERARGEWLAFQDSDDEWLVDKLQQQLTYVRTLPDDYALVGHRLLRHTPQEVESLSWPRLPSPQKDRGEVDRGAFVRGMSAYLQSLMIRRSAYLEVGGFDAALRKSSDLELCLRLARRYRYAALDEVLAMSYETPGSVSQQSDSAVAAWRRILQLHGDFIGRDPAALAAYWTELARCELALDRRRPALAALVQALRAHPRSPRSWFWLGLLPLGAAGVEARRRLRQTSRR